MGIPILIATMVLCLLASLVATFLALPRAPDCPECGSETVPLRAAWGSMSRRWLVRRWCMQCRWEGHSRPERISDTERAIEILRAHPREKQSEAPREW